MLVITGNDKKHTVKEIKIYEDGIIELITNKDKLICVTKLKKVVIKWDTQVQSYSGIAH